MSLPGVAELFRPVGPGPASDSGRQASGREAHPQKITVYLSADEFLDLERARLALRAHGVGVDRGRLVREAIAVLIADLETGIDASVIARRLRAARPGPADGAPVSAAPANGGPLDGAPVSGGLVSGGLAGGELISGIPATGVPGGGLVSGVPGGGGPLYGSPLNGGPAGPQ